MKTHISEKLMRAFGLLSKASARKKVYSQKARQDNNHEISHLLRVISASESIQAHRLFNSVRGQIDTSDQYISTIFENEIEEIVTEYSDILSQAQQEKNRAITPALLQLRAAEKRLLSFYSRETKDVKNKKVQKYFVCKFCGYINLEDPPESCPVCGANQAAFRKID